MFGTCSYRYSPPHYAVCSDRASGAGLKLTRQKGLKTPQVKLDSKIWNWDGLNRRLLFTAVLEPRALTWGLTLTALTRSHGYDTLLYPSRRYIRRCTPLVHAFLVPSVVSTMSSHAQISRTPYMSTAVVVTGMDVHILSGFDEA